MLKLLYAAITGLVGAGVVHISSLLLIPVVSENDAWARLTSVAVQGSFAVIETDAPIAASMRALDANFVVGGCPFSLADGPVLVRSAGGVEFWSLSIYNRRGENVFSVNDRISPNGSLDVAIVTPLQFIEFQNDMPDELANSVLAEANMNEGFVILRAFAPHASQVPVTRKFIETSSCDVF